ncbi:MAG: dihydroneopterin aldolase [Muribaculaceae bacterium]|nr:dihydroneopterin aldolase [Muribaculaceae bacterium]
MMEYKISLNNLLFYAYHGVMEEERKNGNEFRVSLSVFIPYNNEIALDDIDATVSYADLYEIVKEEMAKPKNLLETVAQRIVLDIKSNFPQIKRGEVTIEKMHPPIPGILGTASVSLIF